MPSRLVAIDGELRAFIPDTGAGEGGYLWAIVEGELRDEIADDPLTASVTITTRTRGLTGRIGPDGLFGLIGRPATVLPSLATHAGTVTLGISAPGFLDVEEELTLPPQPAFPESFAPLDLGTFRMHRREVVIRGTVRAAASGAPVAAATVEITGIWRMIPGPGQPDAPASPDIVALRPPLHFGRPAISANLRRRSTAITGNDLRLLRAVRTSEKRLRLSDRSGLANQDVLVVDATDSDLVEHVTIAGFPGGPPGADPGEVELAHSFAFDHRDGAVVRKATLQPAGASNEIAVDARRGDACLILASTADLADGDVAEIDGGGHTAELHRIRFYSTTTGADGRYRLPPLGRVGQVRVRARSGATTSESVLGLDFASQENRLDFVL